MNEQDPLSTYSLWAKQAAILEEKEPNDFVTKEKPNATDGKENMDERRRCNPIREDSGYGVRPRKEVKQPSRRTRIVPSSDSEDAITYVDEDTQTALGPTPPAFQYTGKDDEYASTTRKLARASLERTEEEKPKNTITAAKSKRDNRPPAISEAAKAAREKEMSKQSWSKRALARTKDILSITAKEPSAFAFEDYRNKEFKRAGVKAGDNPAAKLHVSSQKLPPEAPKVQSKEPPPITRNATDANTFANKSAGRFSSSKARTTPNLFGGKGKDGSSHSLASSGSRGSSVVLGGGSGRVSFQGSASGSGSAGGSEMGHPPSASHMGGGRLMHSQTEGSSMRIDMASSAGRGAPATKVLSGKQKAAAIDDRW